MSTQIQVTGPGCNVALVEKVNYSRKLRDFQDRIDKQKINYQQCQS